MLKLIGLGGIDLLGISLDYITALVLIGGGVYVLAYVRLIGAGLIAIGAVIGGVAYGETKGAANCISAERLAAVASERDSLKSQVDGWQTTAKVNQEQADKMRLAKEKADAQMAKWKAAAGKLTQEQRAARAATRDDDRRLCGVVEGGAPGCDLR